MDSNTSPQNQTPVRAEVFYFDDDPMAIFLVENQLFKVHRHFFIQGSGIFRDMFSQARSEDTPTVAEGASDDKPIVLPHVTVKEFQVLLRLFYVMILPIPDKDALADVLVFDQDEKLALLSIAHRFVFDKIFEYICGKIEPSEIPLVDRIRLGDKYRLTKWLYSAYKTILERDPAEKLTREEADALGLGRVVKLLEVKISIFHDAYSPGVPILTYKCSCNRTWSCSCCSQSNARALTAIAEAVEKHSVELSSTVG